jgi:hypothetical protein
MTDHIRYDVLARDAMRGVLRRVLEDAAKRGLPGDHHFYITFLTKADGVKLPDRLLQQHPHEMTIILQHQFWDLIVTEDRFEVGLSFGGNPEKLVVPFSAIKGFQDPSVQFVLEFVTSDVEANEAEDVPAPQAKAQSTAKSAGKSGEKAPAAVSDAKLDAAEHKPSDGAEVVRLDRFRKK